MDIILYGAGRALKFIVDCIEKIDSVNVIEIWDKNKSLIGNKVDIGGNVAEIKHPYSDGRTEAIVVTSNQYYDEIKEQLIKEYDIDEERIKNRNHIYSEVRERIIQKYKRNRDTEIRDVVDGIRESTSLEVFNGSWVKQFEDTCPEIAIYRDELAKMYYTFWNGKRMYLKRRIDREETARVYIRKLLKEQYVHSPHCYQKRGFETHKGDILLDGGAAEGFWSLDHIDVAEHIYICEGDREWLEAMEKTFRPYQDRVTLISKWLGGKGASDRITINDINNERNLDVIKLDIEGTEEEVLRSAVQTMGNKDMRIIACTYHKSTDGNVLRDMLRVNGFYTEFSKGYMVFLYDAYKMQPELRRGLILPKNPSSLISFDKQKEHQTFNMTINN